MVLVLGIIALTFTFYTSTSMCSKIRDFTVPSVFALGISVKRIYRFLLNSFYFHLIFILALRYPGKCAWALFQHLVKQ